MGVSGMDTRYALITPARNELENLRRLVPCVLAQTVAPAAWLIVDDGSTDGTASLASELAERHAWIRLLHAPAHEGTLRDGRREGRDVVAFTAGLDALGRLPEFVVKLDADVSFAPDYFERLLGEFATDPQLGIAGGTCLERDGDGWRAWYVTDGHVRGATRIWRRECLADILPLEVRLGWDGVDELKAATLGWRTRSFREPVFYHHRALAAREGAARRSGWETIGATAHYLGSRPSYVFFRALHHARHEPAALAMVSGYLRSAFRRESRCADAAVRDYLRTRQRLRHLPVRAREVLGGPTA
jgi:glycosyltransferase involved in cell wall biosynthesis